jgi:hypothetical protein
VPPLGIFYEYLEMVVQFGFVILFGAVFPLGPLFVFVNNILEIRLDASKFIYHFRRAVAFPAQDIGFWQRALETINIFAAITNGCVIAFTSDLIEKIVYGENHGGSLAGYIAASYAQSPFTTATAGVSDGDVNCYYKDLRDSNGARTAMWYEVMMAKIAFILLFENFIFALKFAFAYGIPDIPKQIKLEMQREQYKAQEALNAKKLDLFAVLTPAKHLPPVASSQRGLAAGLRRPMAMPSTFA